MAAALKRRYGWRPDLPGYRDKTYALTAPAALPPGVDLRQFCPPVYDQGQLGSCTANALAAACELVWTREGKANPYIPSRLAIYYGERQLEGTIDQDAGAMLRDGIKVLATQGIGPENLWPYDTSKFMRRPPQMYYNLAGFEKVRDSARVPQTLNAMKTVLFEKNPIVIGFTVYAAFESEFTAKTGNLTLPQPTEERLGGHAVLIVGYCDLKRCFIVRNSWSERWGDRGYFYAPYDYFTNPNLADDLWTIKLVP